tara:strand:+ start:63 stop:350 length:288 start_codon:yes stop_codon:yes gene_type:complete
MSIFEWFLVFFAGSMVANGVLRVLLGKTYFLHKLLIEHGYERGYEMGYWDGCTNIKMYHALMNKKVPPSDWLKETMGSRLDTRDKAVEVLNKIPS